MGLFSPKKIPCGCCGKMIIGQYVIVNDTKTGALLYNLCMECNQKFRAAAEANAPYPKSPEEVKQIIEKKTNNAGIIEKRMRCKVCGNVFCYSNKDLERNQDLENQAYRERKQAVWSALGSSIIQSNQETDRADRLQSMIVDYSKCPKCHSADIVEITEEEFKAAQLTEGNEKVPSLSPADEIRKFKELLDLGAITQEEFDAKKKQLLGL